MARTAPAPNLIAIPGMNPGTWVMGGGAGGGGAGGGNGNGEDGAGGAAGENDGQDGEGNGNGTGSCGEGGAGACTNCAAQTSAGDPIDVVTGEVFTGWKNDLWLPGFFDLAIDRKYSTSQRKRDVGFGPGWVHTLAWEIRIEANRLVLWTGTGFRTSFALLAEGEQRSAGGWAILRTADGFYLRAGGEFFHTFLLDPDDPNVARLVGVSYRNFGELELRYSKGRLTSVIDTAGRLIAFERNPEGRIARILVPAPAGATLVFSSYAYSERGDLVQVTDADGFTTRHTYDDDHRLTSTTHPTGLTFHFRYDDRGRGIETWGDYPDGPDVALAPDVPAFLADGTTPARGIFHTRLTFFDDGTSEVTDSVHFHRFFGSTEHPGNIVKAVDSSGGVTTRTLDDDGRELAHEDPLGAVWLWTYDRLGEVVSETDPEGRVVRVERDAEGRILQIVDPQGGTIAYGRDASGNTEWLRDQRGSTVLHRRDDRGQLVELIDRRGASTRHSYDAMGNLVETTRPDGGKERSTYDYFGRKLTVTDPLGRTTTYRYSPGGKLVGLTDSLGRVTRWSHDGLGRPLSQTDPDGGTARITRGGNGWRTALQTPDGGVVRWLYNREGWMTHVINQRGETYRYFYDQEGRATEEHSFDGRVRKLDYDARGRTIARQDVDRGTTDITRNGVGQIVEEQTANGETWTFDYDARGELVGASGPEARFVWERDPVGEVVRETFTIDGFDYTVENALDPDGLRTAYRTSLGHTGTIRRDERGKVAEVWLDGEPAMRVERDAMAHPTKRSLAGGGAIVDRRDGGDRLIARHVESANERATHARHREGAHRDVPDWVGEDGHWQIDTRYGYAANDELVRVESRSEGVTEYRYDLRRHLLEKTQNGEQREAFRVDAEGNYFPARPGDPGRLIEVGNRLVREGDTDYLFDAAGFLCERRRRPASGDQAEVTTYGWNDRELLSHVDLPDGRRVSFAYDAYARRLRKTVATATADGSWLPIRTVHYVWDLTSLLHEVTYLPDGARSIRTFFPEERGDVAPLAHRDDNGKWIYYVGDPNGGPVELIDDTGASVGSLRRDTFGRAIDPSGQRTDVRSPSQIEDEETGLFYNRYRYYDPTIGRFINPDPIGLAGGLNEYAYAPNAVGWFDAMGWHALTVEFTDIDGLPSQPYQGSYPSGWSEDKDKHCDKRLKTEAKAHSERKMLLDLEAAKARKGGGKLGGKVNATGEYPPCKNCHRAMRKFARENDTEITYEWSGLDKDGNVQKQTVTYVRPKGSEPHFEGDDAKTLEGAYELNFERERKRTKTEEKAKEQEQYDRFFKDDSKATAVYKDTKGNAQIAMDKQNGVP
jgi:RHS repeat-associated protein